MPSMFELWVLRCESNQSLGSFDTRLCYEESVGQEKERSCRVGGLKAKLAIESLEFLMRLLGF